MRIIALDVGDKTIGVAASDLMLWTAQGVTVIRRTNLRNDFELLDKIVKEYDVKTVIIGLPKNMNGTIGPRGESVQVFGSQLADYFQHKVEIKYWDERLSTVAAEKMLINADVSRAKRKQVIDKLAAVHILQGYLDSLPRQ